MAFSGPIHQDDTFTGRVTVIGLCYLSLFVNIFLLSNFIGNPHNILGFAIVKSLADKLRRIHTWYTKINA